MLLHVLDQTVISLFVDRANQLKNSPFFSLSPENCVVCIIGTGILMLILIFMVNACWYVADLAIFGNNGRADLNGCSLIFDL